MTRASRPALSRHAALKRRAEGDVLVLPERALRLGGSGGEILHLCDGRLTEADIVATLRERYGVSDAATGGPGEDAVEREVQRFLQEMRSAGAIVDAAAEPHPAGSAAARGEGAADETARPATPTGVAAREPDERRGALAATGQARGPTPLNLIAELTYRCPLQCPYCSNPLDFRAYRESLSASDWARVFREAAELGVVHLGLTGGEPSARSDLEAILEAAVAADLYPHLVTAGLPLDPDRLTGLAERGLRSVQVSIQDATPASSDRIAGTRSFEAKRAICERTRELGLALTLNCVLHRENLASVPALIELAEALDAERLELANTQYHGWALRNRAALMPTAEQLAEASRAVQRAQARQREADRSTPTILFVLPDYHAERPKPCMGGWGRLAMVIDPTGRVLPCHEAGELPGLEFWNANERDVAACWHEAPGMNAFRGTDWMPEPCRSCPDRERDFGGCRCQAFRLLGDAALTDPACTRSPEHATIVAARAESRTDFVPRR